jgi:ribosomal-protein-alanine N-acetyltransferase
MRVRPATPADLPRLAAIEALSFPDPWPEDYLDAYLADGDSLFLVAEVPELAGFVIARDESAPRGGRALHIHDLAVDPRHRRRGVGTALLAAMIGIATAQGIPRLRLEVRVENVPARRFYEAHGFQVVGRANRYYPDGADALRMRLDLGTQLRANDRT